MQRCGYCGKENEGDAVFCPGCGTPLPRADIQTGLEVPRETPLLNAGRATSILLIYFAAQFLTSIIVGAGCASVAVANGKNLQDPKELADFTNSTTIIIVPSSVFAGGLAIVFGSLLLARRHLKDPSPQGAAWIFGSTKEVLKGLLLGLFAGFVYIVVIGALALALGLRARTLGPLASMGATPGLPHFLWLMSLLLFAPPFEELLFRGILYGGYRQSLGHTKAVIVTTGIFSLLHITEWIHFVPALIGITGMAILALWMRLRSGAIGPAVATHFGYNAILATLFSLALSLPHPH